MTLRGKFLVKQIEYDQALAKKKQDRAKANEKKRKEREKIKNAPIKAEKRKQQNRESRYKLKYGITLAEYESMFNAQHGMCAICKLPQERLLVVDHDHNTGHVRGLLCHPCNVALGLFNDSTDRLLIAVDYLKRNTLG